MKPTTNIYVMVDNSFKMQGYSAKIQTLLVRFSRALSFQKHKTKLHTHVILTNVSRYSRDTLKAWKIWQTLKDKGVETVAIPPKKWGYWLNY